MYKHLHKFLVLGAMILLSLPYAAKAQTYCKPTFSSGCSGNYIDTFSIGGYVFATGCTSGSVDTSNVGVKNPIKLYRGKSYDLRIKSSAINHHYGAWLDYNNDGDFSDDGELIIVDQLAGKDTVVAHFTIPEGASLVTTRMRIISVLNDATDGGGGECRSYSSQGEAEDYDVAISAFDDDLKFVTLFDPANNGCTNAAQPIKVVIKNMGINTVTSIPVVVNVNSTKYSQTFTKTLKRDEIDTLTFTSTTSTSSTGTYTISAYTALSGDDDLSNDSFNADITIYQTPSLTSASNATRCGLGNFTFTAKSLTAGTKTFWYKNATSDSVIYAGNSFVTPALTKTTTYYYESQYTLIKSLKTKYFGFLKANTGHMFDINTKSSFIIDSFDIHFGETTSTQPANDTVYVFYKKGTYVGNESKASAWTFVGKAYVKGQGIGNASRLSGFGSIPLEAGNTYAIYMMHITNDANYGRFFRYDNATTDYSNSDMDIKMGCSLGEGAPFKGAVTAGRAWDGEIYYHYKACATSRSSVTGTVNESPLGAKIKESTPFQGLVYDGSFANPDQVCPGDTLTYEFTPPPPYTNKDSGSKWVVTNFSFTTINGTYTHDTTYIGATSSSNPKLLFVPSRTFSDSIFQLKVDLKMTNGGCTGSLTRYIAVGTKPLADFGATKVCVGKSTQFSDSSLVPAGAIGYTYDFGDGSVARTASASHVYKKAGVYDVTLTVTTSRGCADKVTKKVVVYDYPKPNFSAAKVCVGTPTQFTDSTLNRNEIASVLWKFGEAGATSSNANPSYYYAAAGKYNATLVVTSVGGCKDSVTRIVEVMPRPKVDFIVNGACVGKPVGFVNKTTIDQGKNTYQWRFQDGFASTDSNVTHTFADGSSYYVTLIATSSFGCKDSATKLVAAYSFPKAGFKNSPTCIGGIMQFSDESLNAKSYEWNFGDNTAISNSQNPTHFFTKAGSYKVKMKVINENGCADSIIQTVVVSPLPKAGFSYTSTCAGKAMPFVNTSTEGNNAKLTYLWTADNGQTSTDKDPSFTFEESGNHDVKLKVTSEAGCMDSTLISVVVTSAPTPVFTKSVNKTDKRTVTFTPADLSYLNYKWYFGDGDSSTSKIPTHTYAVFGSYTARLIITDVQGCKGGASDSFRLSSVGIEEAAHNEGFLKIYPNPFHNSTKIAFNLDKRSQVQVSVWDVQGRQVALLDAGKRDAGKYEYVFDADKNHAGAGIYILKVLINDRYYTSRIVNVK